jgi:Ser-tRNA(Ala) deacylase AlaX
MKTQQLYLSDSYKQEMDAEVLEVIPEQGNRYRMLLNQTVFYPMGGGQPTDQGTFSSDSWNGSVYQVMMKDGEIWHYVESAEVPTVGLTVHGTINWDRRFLNMRLHSAGHMVDFAMYILGYSPKTLSPMKGDHGKKPYIVFRCACNDITKNWNNQMNHYKKHFPFNCHCSTRRIVKRCDLSAA